jgi:hypothetical protein
LSRARFERNTSKALQFTHGLRNRSDPAAKIKLHYFFSIACPGICHIDRDVNRSSLRSGLRGNGTVGKGGIGQSPSERENRLVVFVDVPRIGLFVAIARRMAQIYGKSRPVGNCARNSGSWPTA